MNDLAETRDAATDRGKPAAQQRQRRNVASDILNAFHFACDVNDLEIAKRLLHALEDLLKDRSQAPGFDTQRALATLVAAHERLWALRQG